MSALRLLKIGVCSLLALAASTPESYASEWPPFEKTRKSGSATSRTKRTTAKPKPTSRSIAYDLIGHTISEGTTEGYHHKDWTYTIENGSVSNFTIEEVLTNDRTQYIIIAKMNLRGSTSPNCNFHYATTAQIRYVNIPDSGWTLDYVNCLGMDVVSDRQYDRMIQARLADDGWGGVNNLQMSNMSECNLIVGGYFYANNQWHKFGVKIEPHGSSGVGGTFGGGSVTDYRIDFVVREN